MHNQTRRHGGLGTSKKRVWKNKISTAINRKYWAEGLITVVIGFGMNTQID